MSRITWSKIKSTVKSRLKTEFDIIKDAEVHRLKQSSTYAGVTGLVASATAVTQVDPSNQWVTLITSVISLYLIYTQKKQN